jgi:predicted O-methyltransferase YrrM
MKKLIKLIQRIKYKFSIDRKRFVLNHIRRHKPNSILEIGVFNGFFAERMIKTASLNSAKKVFYTGVDLFEEMNQEIYSRELSLNADKQEIVYEKLKLQKANVRLLKGFSKNILPQIIGESFDLIIIDGGHSFETVLNDFEYAKKLLSEKGYIFFDDYVNKQAVVREAWGVNQVVNSIDRNVYNVKKSLIFDAFPKPWGILITRMVKVNKKSISFR